jgi:ATP-dependent RNA helicase DDX60
MQQTIPGFKGISAAPASKNIRFLHPIALLSPGIKSLPLDLAFESRDCLTLYDALRWTAGATRVRHLAPERLFAAQDGRLLTNREVIDYERRLKEFVEVELSLDGADNPESVISRTIAALGSDADLSHLEDPSPKQFVTNLLPFILELHKNNELVLYLPRCRCLDVDARYYSPAYSSPSTALYASIWGNISAIN